MGSWNLSNWNQTALENGSMWLALSTGQRIRVTPEIKSIYDEKIAVIRGSKQQPANDWWYAPQGYGG